MPTSILVFAAPDSSLPAAILRGYITQAIEIDRSVVLHLATPPTSS